MASAEYRGGPWATTPQGCNLGCSMYRQYALEDDATAHNGQGLLCPTTQYTWLYALRCMIICAGQGVSPTRDHQCYVPKPAWYSFIDPLKITPELQLLDGTCLPETNGAGAGWSCRLFESSLAVGKNAPNYDDEIWAV
ncbi:hypothetical protein TNCV_509031 [Trichonephila clavipes]|nr:hypothetical protein TNCV_509031 [Trichonephila clavipes]